MKHFMGEVELTSAQVKSAAEMLDRSVAKLSQIQHTGPDGGPVQIAWPAPRSALDQLTTT